MKTLLSPSILAADMLHIGEEVSRLEKAKADWIHFDVMDGRFVPNISFGFPLLEAIRKQTKLFLDVHLMIVEPQHYVERFFQAGADLITVHVEEITAPIWEDILALKKQYQKQIGLSLKPRSHITTLQPYLSSADLILVMSVEPGFGGQTFQMEAVEKIAQLQLLRQQKHYTYRIEVDGGINQETATLCKQAGADVLVAGSYLFHTEMKTRMEGLRK